MKEKSWTRRRTLGALAGAGAFAAFGSAFAQNKSDYKVGDRLPAKPAAKAADAFKEVSWDDLVPPNWDPMKSFRALNLDSLPDSDPRATAALDKLREEWDKAPIRVDMNNSRIRIPGFVIPLERQKDRLIEFLVVPYYGACIHTPPPPSNQIIHAMHTQGVTGFQTMDAVWVSGTLETTASNTEYGNAGYRMRVQRVEPYKRK